MRSGSLSDPSCRRHACRGDAPWWIRQGSTFIPDSFDSSSYQLDGPQCMADKGMVHVAPTRPLCGFGRHEGLNRAVLCHTSFLPA